MKVIFLDNDGVICLDNNWGGRTRKWNEYLKTNPVNHLYSMAPVKYRFDDFDRKAVNVLNDILIKTGAEIVVSSDWRLHATLEEIGDYYEEQGIVKRPIAFTKTIKEISESLDENSFVSTGFYDEHVEFSVREQLEHMRHFEILHYIKDNPNITHWVAIDDLDMGFDIDKQWGLTNFVHTPKMSEGIKQCGKKDKIIQLLNGI